MDTVDSLLQLEDGAAARTSTGNGTGIAVKLRKLRAGKVRFFVTACDGSSTDETYVLTLAVSDVLAGTYTEVARVTVPRGTTGIFEAAVTGVGVQKLDDDSAYARVSWTLGGTTPSITFLAYLQPVT